MKIVIEYQYDSLDKELFTKNGLKEYYEKYFKDKGILYDEECSAIYYVAEIPFMPFEGQRLSTKFGTCIVCYACYEVDDEYDSSNYYYSNSRIVVSEQ